MKTVPWDAFEKYLTCPQWYCWSHETPTKKGNIPFKDTQFLTRGNAIQALVGKWTEEVACLEKVPLILEPSDCLVTQFLTKHCIAVVREEWISDRRGSPQISELEMALEIEEKLRVVLPKLAVHWLQRENVIPSFEVEKNVAAEIEGLLLTARLDVLLMGESPYIYEGKATRYPQRVKEDQLRWQAEILQASDMMPANHGLFYVFYTTQEIREVPYLDSGYVTDHIVWIGKRNEVLGQLKDGNFRATPSVVGCRFCPHRGLCPDKHKRKRRVGPAFKDSSQSGKRKTNFI